MAVAAQPSKRFTEQPNPLPARQPYHNPHTSLGATGHWIRTAGMLAPLLIGELIEDPNKKWRWIRIASVSTALYLKRCIRTKSSRNGKSEPNVIRQCSVSNYSHA
jgi:hypothetical protein